MTVIISNESDICPYCSVVGHKGEQCYKVKSIEYFEDGSVKKVEFQDFRPQPYWYYPPADGTTTPAIPHWTVTCVNTR